MGDDVFRGSSIYTLQIKVVLKSKWGGAVAGSRNDTDSDFLCTMGSLDFSQTGLPGS